MVLDKISDYLRQVKSFLSEDKYAFHPLASASTRELRLIAREKKIPRYNHLRRQELLAIIASTEN